MASSPVPCRYALVQYCHDPVRGEAVNVGVLLERQDDGTTTAAFGDGAVPRRIYRHAFDHRIYRSFVATIQAHLADARSHQLPLFGAAPPDARETRDVPLLDYIHREFGGQYRASEPRPILAYDVAVTLERLRHELVDQHLEAPAVARERSEQKRMHRRLRATFEKRGLLRENGVQENYTLEGRLFGPVTFDFGFQNGHITIFQGLWFGALARGHKLDRAGALALRINDVRHTLDDANVEAYVVIGQQRMTDEENGIAEVQALLEEQRVASLQTDQFEPLVDNIAPALGATNV